MAPGSDFLNELDANAQNPQGAGWGTNWTLVGSIECDIIVGPESATYMDGGIKILYQNPCYPHQGTPIRGIDMLQDNSSNKDAQVYTCTNCAKNAAENPSIWNWSSSFPHTLREMFKTLSSTLPGSAIVRLVKGGSDMCTANALGPNDDSSSSLVSLPFTLNFSGVTYNSLYVNNNGNVSFDTPLWDYTPYPLASTSHVMIAPFFADVDTRFAGSGSVTYGSGSYQGHAAFCVDWLNVGYYAGRTDKLDSFQLLLVNRPDRRAGDFDIVMNHDQIQWETGEASGGTDGFGGVSARAGYTNGNGFSYELSDSGVNGALLDDDSAGLIHYSLGSSQLGRYVFAVVNSSNGIPGKRLPAPVRQGEKPLPHR